MNIFIVLILSFFVLSCPPGNCKASNYALRVVRDSEANAKGRITEIILQEAKKGTFGIYGKEIVTNIEEWINVGFYGNSWLEIKRLVENSNWTELQDAFYKDIHFEINGVKGKIGVGPNRLNKFTIRHVARDIAEFLTDIYSEDVLNDRVYAIFYDKKSDSFKQFSQEISHVFSVYGIKSIVLASENHKANFDSNALDDISILGGSIITGLTNGSEILGTENGYYAEVLLWQVDIVN